MSVLFFPIVLGKTLSGRELAALSSPRNKRRVELMIFEKNRYPGEKSEMFSMLPLKHEMFAQNLVIHRGNQTRAYLEVYKNCAPASAPSKASRLVRNGNILGRVSEILYGNEAIIELSFREIARCLDAEKVIRCGGKNLVLPDYRKRLSAASTCLRLCGYL